MSFSSQLKEELSKINNLANKDLVKAELIGYMISNNITIIRNRIRYATENEYNINRLNKLLTNLNINYKIELQGKVYVILFNKQDFEEIFYKNNNIIIKDEKISIKQKDLYYRAIIRGAFLGGGSLNEPNNKYHLEIIFSTYENAEYVVKLLSEFGIQAKILNRKNSTSLYIKEAEEISKFLALIGANKSVLSFEEIRVLRETRNNVNRLVNCETANLNKTINASVEQINAIKYLKKVKKFEELPENLKEIAKIRLENPDLNLVQLGNLLDEPLGKSGVNHRLKKICQIADEIKKEK